MVRSRSGEVEFLIRFSTLLKDKSFYLQKCDEGLEVYFCESSSTRFT